MSSFSPTQLEEIRAALVGNDEGSAAKRELLSSLMLRVEASALIFLLQQKLRKAVGHRERFLKESDRLIAAIDLICEEMKERGVLDNEVSEAERKELRLLFESAELLFKLMRATADKKRQRLASLIPAVGGNAAPHLQEFISSLLLIYGEYQGAAIGSLSIGSKAHPNQLMRFIAAATEPVIGARNPEVLWGRVKSIRNAARQGRVTS